MTKKKESTRRKYSFLANSTKGTINNININIDKKNNYKLKRAPKSQAAAMTVADMSESIE